MNRKQLFVLVNSVLIAIAGFSVYYLATAEYVEPREIAEARRQLEPSSTQDEISEPHDPGQSLRLNDVRFFDTLIELTPTPTRTPRATPTPFPIKDMLYPWRIISMSENSVTIFDQQSKEEFDMTVGGTNRNAKLNQQSMDVQLISVNIDADPLEATFRNTRGDTYTIKMQF